ncbi:P-loop containing nucleoside triphosphate hydrolase protein [Xylariaceae sp. FL0662B]|nr:P-loop containing nucleoside triphosphate hydrolase protein [Xylariaceae sp. FL0662B]
MDYQSIGRRTLALVRKNFTIAVIRQWFSTTLRSLVFPIALLVLLLEIQNFSKNQNKYGVGSPRSVQSLADSMRTSGKNLVLVQEPGLGPDFPSVLGKITEPLDQNRLIRLNGSSEIDATCPVDYHGNSPCHAVVVFKDSPLSGKINATWNYTIKTDPAIDTYAFNVFETSGPSYQVYLPLQLAVENSMANLTANSDFMPFTAQTQEETDEDSRRSFIELAEFTLSMVFYATFIPVSHHVSSMMASERESGMSQLIDAMGGGLAFPRVISYVVTFDLLYLPLYIIMGALYQTLLLPHQSAAVTIFWQIFMGWATTSASVFGVSFFKRAAFASLWVSLIPWLIAIVLVFITYPPSSTVMPLAFFFPSANFIYFFTAIGDAEVAGVPLDMQRPTNYEQVTGFSSIKTDYWVTTTASYFLWVFLAIQIIVYPLLAVLVETYMHGNNRRRRGFTTTPEAQNSHIAIETTDLVKHYNPSWLKRLFCCSRAPTVKAVDGLNLVSQKRQILCLLGPNGSGKTTTLDMLAGFQTPTAGSVNINAAPSQIGICPQRNVMWPNLTVYEHLVIWNTLKDNADDPATLEQLIEKCDLTHKRNSFAGNLSGGMKRKLQLACMLVGGSSICLMDEVTSGLDPLSRRAIWNVVLSERSRRTMVLTTHFLDECEVLSDHIVIITLGKLKCQGTPAELKNEYGGGYRVNVPTTEDISGVPYPVTERHGRFICRTPDSASAARLLASLKTSKDSELYVTGPTIEDVFLKVSEEPHTLIGEAPEEISLHESEPSRQKGLQTDTSLWFTYSRQIRALLLKRILVLRSFWWAYFFALLIPILATHFLGKTLEDYVVPDCKSLIAHTSYENPMRVYNIHKLALGPQSVNATVADVINSTSPYRSGYDDGSSGPFIQNSRVDLEAFIHGHPENITSGGGLWIGNDTTPLIAYNAANGGTAPTRLLNLANQVRGNVSIAGYLSSLTSYQQAEGGQSMFYATIFCLLHALYPAFFVLYPTYERRSKVHALQYSNGVAATLLVILALYGLAAILFAYLITLWARSQPAAFAASVILMVIIYVLSVIPMLVIQMNMRDSQVANDGVAFGLGLIFPVQNLFRAVAVSLNMYIVRCRGQNMITDPGSIYAFGGPIMLLIIQIIVLFCLLLWLEGGSFAWLSRRRPLSEDAEKISMSGRPDVDAETRRVTASESDLLRLLHVSKSFGSNVAVDDVSLGLQPGEILALLGPNGAGKTTTVNMVRGDLTPTSGKIYLEGIDVQKNTRLAQKHLGVCPQFDALDTLTVREHLQFYARCKGVTDVEADVSYVLRRVGLSAHAHKLAAKLSGGNKRKLSLAIALLGNPPVLLLDEPSSAMDAASKRVLWKTLEAVAPGRSVLLTTHSMEEADALATRAAIVARGVRAVGSTQQLRRRHCNEYHVHLILRSAPLSSPAEMRRVADWVRDAFPDVLFEGENLGGQVRFIVPADSRVPAVAQRRDREGDADAGADTGAAQSFTRFLIETLETKKAELGIDCYSISAATMESVFLKVVKESDADEDEGHEKKGWWRW